MSARPETSPAQRLAAAATALLVGAALSGCAGGSDPRRSPAALPAATPLVAATSMAADPGPATPSGTAEPSEPGRLVVPAPRAAHVDRIEVGKCWTNATRSQGGQLLIAARSSDPAAHLRAYRADGSLIGDVANGGGQRYGGTVFAYERTDPVHVTIRSSAGGSVTVATTSFRVED
ncbi:hypothetical protein [Terracoccus sp. 273MFTsu3.1]|uniref:hypothetical protein n=1 Tax=Terracoccus sp. 273MFTsu3.1 TaxID=1172188 RepID=UPI000382A124|nr:hypothetical protein [Terracoccus sp. 273MFTsu3.1]